MTFDRHIYLDEEGEPTPEFEKMVDGLVGGFMATYNTLRQSPADIGFYAVGVFSPLGAVSYWGIIDMKQTPDEDIYPLVDRYMYSAVKSLGEGEIAGYGIVDLGSVIRRQPFRGRPAP